MLCNPQLSYAEIENFHEMRTGIGMNQEYIGGFEVTMDHATRMCGTQRINA